MKPEVNVSFSASSKAGLLVIEKQNAMEVFTKADGLNPFIEKVKEEVKLHIPDLTTDKGRKAIASLAARVSKSKTYLDGVGKELVSEWKTKSKLVDNSRKAMREELDALRDEARKPLTEWEKAEELRKKVEIKKLKKEDDHAEALNEDELFDLRAEKAEREAEELVRVELEQEKLRKVREELAKKEHDKRVAKQASEEAERKAKQAEKDKIDAQKRAEQAEKDKILAESKAKRDAEQAEKDRIEAAELAARDAHQASLNAQLQADKAAKQAKEDEKQRQYNERIKQEAEKAKLEANTKHVGAVRGEIKNHLIKSCKIDNELAVKIVKALLKTPRITVNY